MHGPVWGRPTRQGGRLTAARPASKIQPPREAGGAYFMVTASLTVKVICEPSFTTTW